jgi:hypothetical protein
MAPAATASRAQESGRISTADAARTSFYRTTGFIVRARWQTVSGLRTRARSAVATRASRGPVALQCIVPYVQRHTPRQ